MYRIGVDLGGTNIAVGVIDENYKIIGNLHIKLRKNSAKTTKCFIFAF